MTIWTILSLLAFGALVNGPLFSLDASGQLGKALVYAKWKGRAYVREYVIPANPRSLAQQFQRGILAALTRWWAGTNATPRATWQALADAGNYSTFNAFQKFNLDAETLGNYPQATADLSGAAVAGVNAAPTGTGGVNTIAISHDPATAPAITDLLIIGLGTAGGANTTAQDIHRIIASLSNSTLATATILNVSNIPAGTYFLASRYVGQNGSLSAWIPSAAGIVVTGV